MKYQKIFMMGISSFLLIGMMTSVLCSQEWTGWKGPNYDGKSSETGLLSSWPKEGPPLLWTSDSLGEGYSNLAFWKDMIFTEGDIKGETYLFILNRAEGKLLRKIKVGTGGDIGGYPGPRSTPCTDGERVYTLNHFGILCCIEITTGRIVWSKKYESDFNGAMMLSKFLKLHWGFSESPLLDGDRLICSPGGKQGTFAALDKLTGNVIWRSTELTDESAYSSVLPVTIDGVRQYLFATPTSVGGLNPADGTLFWKTDYPGITAVACDPIYCNGIVFMAEAYEVGGYAWRVRKAKEGNRFSVESAYQLRKVDNKHHGLVAIDNFLYSATDRGSFVCVDLLSGKIQWEERRMRGKASAVFADGRLILRKENTGEIILIEPNPKKYTEISRFEQPERSNKNAWTYPLVVDKKLYIRDQDKIFCFDLADKK